MTLRADIATPPFRARTGQLMWIGGGVSGWSGLVEPKWGWLLCNGATFDRGAYGPTSGLSLQALYDKIAAAGNRYGGAGVLPNFLDGKQPIPKGAGTFTSVGAVGGEISHALTLHEYPSHRHWMDDDDDRYARSEDDGYPNGYGPAQNYPPVRTTNAWGSAAPAGHNNMPTYVTVGAVLVRI